jgi:hypothetical protein
MVWLLLAISICAVNVLAGRAYSRSLDRKSSDPIRQFLNGLPLSVEQVEANDHSTRKLRSSGRPRRASKEEFRPV